MVDRVYILKLKLLNSKTKQTKNYGDDIMLIQNWTDEMHIQIFNEMVDENSERKLTVEELYVYSVLSIKSQKDYSMITDVDTIAYIMQMEFEDTIRFAVKENNHKIKIREALKGLISKGYLESVYKIELDKLKNNTKLTLVISDDIENKFTKIYYNEFRMMKSADELFIYTVAKRFSYGDGFKGSYDRWAKLLDVSVKTAVKKLENAEYKIEEITDQEGDKVKRQTGVIKIVRGRYESKNQQEINLYRHVDLMSKNEVDGKEEEEQQHEQQEQEEVKTVESTESVEQEPVFAFGAHVPETIEVESTKRVVTIDKSRKIKEEIGDSLPF